MNASKQPGLWLLAAVLLVGPASGQTLQARSGASGWRAVTAEGNHCVFDREGAGAACWPAAAGSQLTDLVEVADGWVAAGARPGAESSELFLVAGDRSHAEPLAAPAAGAASRGRPQLVSDGDHLLGLVWLEGDRQETLAVRAAEWLGTAWAPTTTVSPPAVGSQVAPTATVLEDHRWLVLWTAFDGEDDETLWSSWDGRRWSSPAPVHENNHVPDITPSVLATGKGAAAAWSWFDGRDYRLRLAAFDGRQWHEHPVKSGRGVAWPRLTAGPEGLLLSFSSVVPAAWVALELDAAGRVVERAELASEAMSLPWVRSLGYGVEFEWPGSDGKAVAWETSP